MAPILHPATGFVIGDPDVSPFEVSRLPNRAEIAQAASTLILSASGWRKVFASADPESKDAEPRAAWAAPRPASAQGQDEDSLSPYVAPADLFLAATMARVFVEYLREKTGRKSPAILLGMDTRPTGPALGDAMCRIFLGLGARPRQLFIVAAPEIMAYARSCGRKPQDHEEYADAFCYISASHNPPGHNGVKFGLAADGGVLPVAEATALIERFKEAVATPDLVRRILYIAEEAAPKELGRIYALASAEKRRSVSAYTLLAREIVTGSEEPDAQEAFLDAMSRGAELAPLGVLAELNGSARCLSIDQDFLAGAGVSWRAINDRPRGFVHRIVPEGESLEECWRALEAAQAEDPSFVAGYVPDCDGDRGNLVIYDKTKGRGRVLAAQEVFALCCVAESAQLVREGRLGYDASGRPDRRVAIAVNDGTSMRIEAIAKAFGIEVRRAETGEANVVGLAARLREEGYLVRILGEGSNGGNITFPSAVRDPLATVGALVKLLLLRDPPGEAGGPTKGLFRLWLERSGQDDLYRPDFDLGDIIASLPAYATTSAFEPIAALRIASADHGLLKDRYKVLFLEAWEREGAELRRRFGAVSWQAFGSRGSAELPLGEDFASSGRGGLRLVLRDEKARDVAFVWMRGSGTEPVFRVMADVAGGSAENEAWLIDWHRRLVLAADALAFGATAS
jgi:phosphoglucomutase